MYNKIVLHNGLTVIIANMPHMESISIGIWIAAGGRYESKKESGISHFFEHMAFKGTKKRTYKELKETIEGKGGVLNGFTGEECTCYLAKVPSNHLGLAADTLSDMATNARLDTADFNKEKGVILEEIKMYLDMPHYHVQELLGKLMWPDQPLGMPLIGTFQTVANLRQSGLLAFKNRYYVPKNIVVAVAGRIKSQNFIGVLEKTFSKKRTGKSSFIKAHINQNKPRAKFHFKKTEQTHLAIGLHGYGRFHPRRYDAGILNIILGGNMSSRLFNEVREKRGLAYEIHSSAKCYSDTGAFMITAGIDNKKVSEAVDVILTELEKIKKSNVRNDEFERAIEFYKGQLLMMFEETSSHMVWLGEKVLCQEENFRPKHVLRQLDKVTIDSVRETARGIFNADNLNLAVIGPQKEKIKKKIKNRLKGL